VSEVSSDDPMKNLEKQTAQQEAGKSTIKKLGLPVYPWLRYGSLVEESDPNYVITKGFTTYMSKPFDCGICQKRFIFNLEQLREHLKICKPVHPVIPLSSHEVPQQTHQPPPPIDQIPTEWKCSVCGESFSLKNPTGILKHKKTHATQ
jgi:hypothetical protein